MSDGRLPGPLRLFLFLVCSLAAASFVDVAVGFLHHGAIGYLYLWPPYPAFDFVDYTVQFPYRHTPQFFSVPAYPWFYPAPAIFALYPFYRVVELSNRVAGYVVFVLVVALLDLFALRRWQGALERSGLPVASARLFVWCTALLCWPLYLGIQRGNIEALLWLGVALGVSLIVQRRFTAGGIVLGIIGAAKLYPLIFLALLLKERRYREIGYGVAVACLTTLAGLRFLEPDILFSSRQISSAVQRWTVVNLTSNGALGFDHSLFAVFRQLNFDKGTDVVRWLHPYMATVALLATALFFLRAIRLPRPNQVLFVACCTVLLPSTSYDYTLAGMLIPFGWLVLLCARQSATQATGRRWHVLFALFAVVFAPLAFLHSHTRFHYVQASIRALALLGLLVYSLVVRIEETSAEQGNAAAQGSCPRIASSSAM